jgi:hypothetical protein
VASAGSHHRSRRRRRSRGPALATGTNPAGHGIYDFIRRDRQSYLADFSLNRFEQRTCFCPRGLLEPPAGRGGLGLLLEGGHSFPVIRCPCTSLPMTSRDDMLSGMGVGRIFVEVWERPGSIPPIGARRGRTEHLIPVQVADEPSRPD